MRNKILCFFIFLISLVSFAQEYLVNGVVSDVNNDPISFANVLITNSNKTNQTPKGTSTDEKGYFIIENLESGNYKLKISFIGYESYSIDLEITKNLNLDHIILKENLEELDGVTVVAKRPTVKRLVDRVIFNVENSTLSNSNVLDVLKNTPGVIVSDGSITVKQSVPTIYINDRKVHLSATEVQQLLEGTSASNIKSIEVITNPPAKYEAEGGAVLNIVTSKNIVAGYNGSIFGNYKQGSEYPKYSIGTSHFFKAKKLNTYVNYNTSPRKDFRHNEESINFIGTNNQVFSSWETDFNRTHETANQHINANIDYQLNDNNSLSISTNMLISPRENTKTSVNSLTKVFNANRMLDSTFNTINSKVDETFNLAFTLDYIHKFKKVGEKLSVSTHHTNYDFSSFQNVDTDYRNPDNSFLRTNRFQTFSSQKIKLYTGQIDYESPINESSNLETGGKVSKIDSESVLNQFTFNNGTKKEDLQNSDTFLYDETIYAAYSSFSKDWESWSLKLGLRAEYTDTRGNSLFSNQVNQNDYLEFFPSFYINHKFNANNEIHFNYSRRIYRPRYNDLNPFRYFLTDNSFVAGNPQLKPQLDDSFKLGYTFNSAFTFEVFFLKENDPVLSIAFQDNENNILKYINTNTDKSISYGLDFTTYTKITNRWSLYALSSIFNYENNYFALESNGELGQNNKWIHYTQIINYFSFLKDKSLTADVSFIYLSPIVEGPSIISEWSSFEINLRKMFWDNRASITLGITDAFNTQNISKTTKYLNQDVYLKSQLENRLFTVGFNYKFGNFRLKTNKKEINIIERERLGSN